MYVVLSTTKCIRCKTANGTTTQTWSTSKFHILIYFFLMNFYLVLKLPKHQPSKLWTDHMDREVSMHLVLSHKLCRKRNHREANTDLPKIQVVTVMLQNQKFCIREIQIKKDQKQEENHLNLMSDHMLRLHHRCHRQEADLTNNQLWARTIWLDSTKLFQIRDQNHRSNLNIAEHQLQRVVTPLFSQPNPNNKRKWKFTKLLKN